MLIKWVKWKNYIRWKHKWSKFKLLDKKISGRYLWIAILCYDLITFLSSFFGSFLIFKWIFKGDGFTNNDSVLFMIINTYTEMLKNNHNLIWSYLLMFLLLYCFSIGVKSSRWSDEQKENDFILINTLKKPIQRRFYLLAENIVWFYRELIIKLLPVFLALSLLINGKGIFRTFLIVSFIYFFSSTFFAFLHVLIFKIIVNFRKNLILSSLLSLSFRLAIIYVGFCLSKYLISWILSFPLINPNTTGKEYNAWLFEGSMKIIESVTPLFSFITKNNYFPFVYLQKLLDGSISAWDITRFIFVYFISFASILLLLKIRKVNSRRQEYFEYKSIFGIKIPRKIRIQLKIFLNSEYTQKKFTQIFGGKIFWILCGFVCGATQSFYDDEKIYYFFMAILLYHQIFFNVTSLYENFKAKLALESDGKYILLYLNAKKNLWSVFKRKFTLGILINLPSLLLSLISLLLFGKIDIGNLLLIFLTQINFLILSLMLMYIPSIYSLHLELSNPEQISEHPDNKVIENSLSFLVQGMFIPTLLIPTALFILNEINLFYLILWQFGICTFIILTLCFILYQLIKTRLSKVQYIDDFI